VPVQGRVGETKQECVSRYGEQMSISRPYRNFDEIVMFTKDGYVIWTGLKNGKVVSISYNAFLRDSDGLHDRQIPLESALDLLAKNGGKRKWRDPEVEKDEVRFSTVDGDMRARVHAGGVALAIALADYPLLDPQEIPLEAP